MAKDIAPLLGMAGFMLIIWGWNDDRTASFDNSSFMLEIAKIVAGAAMLAVAILWGLAETWFK